MAAVTIGTGPPVDREANARLVDLAALLGGRPEVLGVVRTRLILGRVDGVRREGEILTRQNLAWEVTVDDGQSHRLQIDQRLANRSSALFSQRLVEERVHLEAAQTKSLADLEELLLALLERV